MWDRATHSSCISSCAFFLHDLRAKRLRVGNSFSIPVRRKYLGFFFYSISKSSVRKKKRKKRIRNYIVCISFSFISQLNLLGSTNVLCGNYICNFRSHVFIQKSCELYVCVVSMSVLRSTIDDVIFKFSSLLFFS